MQYNITRKSANSIVFPKQIMKFCEKRVNTLGTMTKYILRSAVRGYNFIRCLFLLSRTHSFLFRDTTRICKF